MIFIYLSIDLSFCSKNKQEEVWWVYKCPRCKLPIGYDLEGTGQRYTYILKDALHEQADDDDDDDNADQGQTQGDEGIDYVEERDWKIEKIIIIQLVI